MSAGQIRIREIISQYLPTYQRLKGDASFAYLPHKILHEIRERFNQDDTIRNDSITGIDLSNPIISKNYVGWLESSNSVERITENFPRVNLNRFIYSGGSGKLAYLCGVKYETTISCLFSIANRDRISKDCWNSVYFPCDGILKTGGNGSHRLLAHVLYGKSEISPDYMDIYENQNTSDKILHSSLLKLESFFF